jgi:hypothetical protein
MQLIIMQLSPPSCHFISLSPNILLSTPFGYSNIFRYILFMAAQIFMVCVSAVKRMLKMNVRSDGRGEGRRGDNTAMCSPIPGIHRYIDNGDVRVAITASRVKLIGALSGWLCIKFQYHGTKNCACVFNTTT